MTYAQNAHAQNAIPITIQGDLMRDEVIENGACL